MSVICWVGWILFVLVLAQYLFGTHYNSKKAFSMAAYCTYMLLHRNFYDEQHEVMLEIVQENQNVEIRELSKGMIQTVQSTADKYGSAQYCVENGLPFAPVSVIGAVNRLTRYYKSQSQHENAEAEKPPHA